VTLPATALLLLALCLSSPADVRAQWTSASGKTTTADSVGVGTAAPGAALEVNKSQNAGTTVVVDNGNTAASNGSFSGFYFRQGGVNRFALGSVNDGNTIQLGGAGAAQVWNFANGAMIFGTNSAERMRISAAGFVGVGTSTPLSALHVHSTTGAQWIRVSGAGGGINFVDTSAVGNQQVYQWRSEGGAFRMALVNDTAQSFVRQNILVANAAGNVGFGTANPNYQLVVGPEMQAGMSAATMTVSKGAGASSSIAVGAGGAAVTEFGWDNANTRAFLNTAGTTPMAFTQDGTNVRLYIGGGGNVGVGTSTPNASYKLDVNGGGNFAGDLHATGNVTGNYIEAKYQDMAEWVASVQKLQAGTVVILDTERTNHVVASGIAYDTKVAGVVSDSPGVLLGTGGEGRVKVATTGRVRVKVDATHASIKVGDLLVTSGVEGVAMKSVPVDFGGTPLHRPGTIIGKALEPLEQGTGEILVLLSLQ
jgi:hypothetical protein